MSDPHTAEDWAGSTGDNWRDHADAFESMISPAGDAFMAQCGFQSGERVIDSGCGAGATSLAIARAVTPGGEVVGLDISAALTAEASRRADAAGVANLRFETCDASIARPGGAPFDRLFSRFGSMFFADPPAAFANLRAMLRPGGRADFAVWASPADNPWITGLREVVTRHVAMPPSDPHAPGPFSLSDPGRFRALLEAVGWTDVDAKQWRGMQYVGGAGATPEAAAAFALEAMPFGEALRLAGGEVLAAGRTDLATFFAEYHDAHGVSAPASAWFVSARA